MPRFNRTLLAAFGASQVVLAAGRLEGQRPDPLAVSATELARSLGDAAGGNQGTAKGAREGQAIYVLTRPGAYGSGRLKPFLDSLEDWALGGRPGLDPSTAAYLLTLPGSRAADQPIKGNVIRLRRVHANTTDAIVRLTVIDGMADQAEAGAAKAFLEEIATSTVEAATPGHSGIEPIVALGALVRMGADGRVVLQRLHATGAVEDPEARRFLATLAAKDFVQ